MKQGATAMTTAIETTKTYTTSNLFGKDNVNKVEFFIADCETVDEEMDQFCFAVVTMPIGSLVFEAQSTGSGDINLYTWMVIANDVEEYRDTLKGTYAKVSTHTKEDWESLGFSYKG